MCLRKIQSSEILARLHCNHPKNEQCTCVKCEVYIFAVLRSQPGAATFRVEPEPEPTFCWSEPRAGAAFFKAAPAAFLHPNLPNQCFGFGSAWICICYRSSSGSESRFSTEKMDKNNDKNPLTLHKINLKSTEYV